jgi:adenine-specific DNA-methyltransferase
VAAGDQDHHGLIHSNALKILPKLPSQSVHLTLTSPPYYVGKAYDTSTDIEEFRRLHEKVLPQIVRITKDGGSICWQVGYHVSKGHYTPLDFIIHEIMSQFKEVHLQNRTIWEFGHGLHLTRRFSGRHEVILWYSKGKDYYFDLDAVRVPQKYPGKLRYKGEKKGEISGNPLGKNPSDVWEFPNVKAAHVEKTEHPCQFPIALAQRLIRALTQKGDVVLDPFVGSGSTAVAAALDERSFIAIEINKKFVAVAQKRIEQAAEGTLRHRDDSPPLRPDPTWKVARFPDQFRNVELDS